LEQEALIEALRNQIWQLTKESADKSQHIRALERALEDSDD